MTISRKLWTSERLDAVGLAVANQDSVTVQLGKIGVFAKTTDDALTAGAQLLDFAPQAGVAVIARVNTGLLVGCPVGQLGQHRQIQREPRGRARATEGFADMVVATAVTQRSPQTRRKGRKYDAGVVVIAAQFTQIEIQA